MANPVLIVGAGPTGLTAALELSRMGVAVRLIEKAAAPATTSRAIGVQARTLEMLQQRGLADRLIARGVITRHASFYGEGKALFRLDFGHVQSRFPYMLFVPEVETEAMLRDAIAAQGVAIEWDTELIALAQHSPMQADALPRAVLRRSDGALEEVRPSWIISAEGAHSVVRQTLDLPFDGATLAKQFALGDIHVDGALSPEELYIFSSDEGFLGMFPLGRGRFRLIASDPPGDPEGPAPSLAELQEMFDRRAHLAGTFRDLVWSSWFRINSRMVSRLRVGRLLLGGDAAHIHSPAGAQGMNTGMQDMFNLGWKLARVICGKAPLALLDSYEAERLPVIREVLFGTEKLTDGMASTNPVRRTLIDHVGPWLGPREIVQEHATARMSQVAIGYPHSPLSERKGARGALRAGDRLPDFKLQQATAYGWRAATAHHLLDPSDFTVFFTLEDETGQPAQPFPKSFAIRPTPAEPAELHRLIGASPQALLVRPDGYVALCCPLEEAPSRLRAYAEAHLGGDAGTSVRCSSGDAAQRDTSVQAERPSSRSFAAA